MNKTNIQIAKDQLQSIWVNNPELVSQEGLGNYLAYVQALEGFVESFIDYQQSGKPSLGYITDLAYKLQSLTK